MTARTVTMSCWGTSHTEHLRAQSSRLVGSGDLPQIGESVLVDRVVNGGFVELLRVGLATQLPDIAVAVHNHGTGGATSRDLLAALEKTEHDQDLALFECGTNDVLRNHQGRHQEAVDVEEFTANYRAALVLLTSRARKVVCIGSPPVGPGIGAAAEAINRDLLAYNTAARRVANDIGACFVDNWAQFVTTAALLQARSAETTDEHLALWDADGLHLSPLGGTLVARSLEPVVIDLIKSLAVPARSNRAPVVRGVAIRPAVMDDIPGAVALKANVAAEEKWIGSEPPIDTDKTTSRLADLIDGDGTMFVAAHEQMGVIGSATATFTSSGVASITMMVAERHRGGGIGRTLLDQLITWCRNNEAHKVTLQAWAHNSPAIRLYRQAGFETEGILRAHYRRRNGELWDAVIMSRQLRTQSGPLD